MKTTLRTPLRVLALLAAFALPTAAQEDERPPLPEELAGMSDQQREMMELFAKVERALEKIDLFLSDAAAGEVPLELPEESGLADLLRQTRESSRSTIEDIDRILELAASQRPDSSPNSGGGQPEQQQPSGESPLDRNRNQTPQEQESTPEEPADGSDQPQPDSQDGRQPEDGEDSQEETENQEGPPPTPGESGAPAGVGDGGDRWGELPPRVREVFRSQGGGDLPTQYRDWIDSYYRRLNRQP